MWDERDSSAFSLVVTFHMNAYVFPERLSRTWWILPSSIRIRKSGSGLVQTAVPLCGVCGYFLPLRKGDGEACGADRCHGGLRGSRPGNGFRAGPKKSLWEGTCWRGGERSLLTVSREGLLLFPSPLSSISYAPLSKGDFAPPCRLNARCAPLSTVTAV